jgi:predicted ribosomally synthesized peptide with SipW-like signal peptide
MNKKILMSGMSIVASLAIMGGTTFALFDDSVTATNNTFAVGNADLQIAPDTGSGPGTFVESIPGPSFTGMFPGQTKTFEFWLKNSSTSTIDLALTADVSAINPAADGDQDVDNVLLVSWVCDTDGDGGVADNTPSSEFSPRDWFTGGNAGVGTLIPGEQMICRMFGELPSSASETVEGETVAFDAKYDATQVVAP